MAQVVRHLGHLFVGYFNQWIFGPGGLVVIRETRAALFATQRVISNDCSAEVYQASAAVWTCADMGSNTTARTLALSPISVHQ